MTDEQISTIELTGAEQVAVRTVLRQLMKEHASATEHEFFAGALLSAQELPRRIREGFHCLGSKDQLSALLIRNNPIDSSDIGPTPKRHYRAGEERHLNAPQMLHGLYASLLGEPIGFATQQNGRIFHDLLPLPGAPSNSSSGSGAIGLHTEDYSVTQPHMPDYLGLMALRNEQGACTTISSIRSCSLGREDLDILFGSVFPFRNSLRQSVLFGQTERPFLRLSAIYKDRCTPEMKRAFDNLSSALKSAARHISLKPGDALYIDNYVAVHGREAFEHVLGPSGRWFSRLCIIRDLRRLSGRVAPGTRIINAPPELPFPGEWFW